MTAISSAPPPLPPVALRLAQGGWWKACQSPSKANLSKALKEAELSLK